MVTTAVVAGVDHGTVATIKRVIMERDTYAARWGHGPRAQEKKKLVANGQLDSKGKPNEKTPKSWLQFEGYIPRLTSFASNEAPAHEGAPKAARPELEEDGLVKEKKKKREMENGEVAESSPEKDKKKKKHQVADE